MSVMCVFAQIDGLTYDRPIFPLFIVTLIRCFCSICQNDLFNRKVRILQFALPLTEHTSASVEPVRDLEASPFLMFRHFYPPFLDVWFTKRYGFPG